MDLWHSLDPGHAAPYVVNAIIEIPKDSQNKFEYDKKHGIIKLDRVLFSPMHYPGDYGFIPQTLSHDGDPLDVLIFLTHGTYPGILMEARPIGVLKMIDGSYMDEKILCVAVHDPRHGDLHDITDVQKHLLEEIAHFFEVYKHLEGKKVKIIGWGSSKEAHAIIKEAIKLYKKEFSGKEGGKKAKK